MATSEIKTCSRHGCRAVWTCRVCERKTCEHLCGRKDSKARTAVCGRCGIEQAQKRWTPAKRAEARAQLGGSALDLLGGGGRGLT